MILLVERATLFGWNVNLDDIYYDFHNSRISAFLVVLLVEQENRFHDCFYELQKCNIGAHSSCIFIDKLRKQYLLCYSNSGSVF